MYRVGEAKADLVDLKKTYELNIDGDTGSEEPYLQVQATGNGVFDRKAGLMRSMQYDAKLIVSEDNVTVRIPITMRYDLMSQQELAKEKRDHEADQKELEKQRAELERMEANTTTAAPFKTSSISNGAKGQSDAHSQSVKSAPTTNKLNRFDPNK